MSQIWQKIYIGLHVQYRLLLCDCNGTCIFSIKRRISNFVKIPLVGPELFQAERHRQTDRRMDMTYVTVTLRKSAYAHWILLREFVASSVPYHQHVSVQNLPLSCTYFLFSVILYNCSAYQNVCTMQFCSKRLHTATDRCPEAARTAQQ